MVLGGCGTEARRRDAGAPAARQATPPPEASAKAVTRLALVGAGKVRIVDAAAAPDAPALREVPVADASDILDVSPSGDVIVRTHFHAEKLRVWHVDLRGAHELFDPTGDERFVGDGRIIATETQRRASCGGMFVDSTLRVQAGHGPVLHRVPGRIRGRSADGRAYVTVQSVEGACRPAGGRELAMPLLATVDLAGDARPLPIEGHATVLGVMAGDRAVAGWEVDAAPLSSGGTLAIANKRIPIANATQDPIASPDGRWVAVSVELAERAAAVQVYRVAEGTLAATHACGRPVSTVGLNLSSVGMCFSPDGEMLVLARPDLRVVGVPPAGGTDLDLGQGSCVGFSPDGARLLLRGTGGRTSFRIATVATREIRDLPPDVTDARFLPAPP